MILLKESGYLVKSPKQKLPKEISNILSEDLQKGYCIFIVPEKFDFVDDAKNFKKTYKVGFLYDLLSEIYPAYGKTEKFKIISEKYHFWFTYRQFKNITDEYFENRANFLSIK